ncbi:phage antirepressor KilAC domain-containing protein [Erwinia aphidicola]|uniref:phage antirepressor KilAC domain-containing protein n=1 Tax=Erwinia aphidicola TaxID=68334 RepID=UPI003D1DB83C
MPGIITTGKCLTMTSREIAELTGKQHAHVMRDIEVMLVQLNEPAEGYVQNWVHPQNGQQYREYALDREHTECLVTGYNAMLRMKVIKRLHELEGNQPPSLPQTLPEALRLAADLAEEKQQMENQLAIAAPKIQFVDSYVNATGSLGFRETCKLLHAKENAFRQFLLDHDIMYLLAGKLTPYAQHIDAGRFTIKTGENQNNGHAFTQNKFTPKGIQWIAGLWAARQVQERAA